jgi:hypothetical protein
MSKLSLDQNLPPCLGLGTLDSGSVSTRAGTTKADYRSDGELIYQITLGKNRCVIQEFLDGDELGQSTQITLKDAFTHHLMSLPPYENRRFEHLYHRICDNRNIHVEFVDQPEAIFFPAGYIFVLRLPIMAGNQAKWKSVRAKLKRAGDSAPLQFDAEHTGIIFRLDASGRAKAEPVTLVDCTATLVNVAAAADWLWQSGMVLPEKEHRLMVLDASLSLPGQLRLYLGEPGQGVQMFSVLVADSVEMNLKEATRSFRESSRQFLASRPVG